MKKFNIPKIMINDGKIIAKTLLGLCVLSAAIKGCNSGCRAMDQRKKAQEEADKKTFATLIDKKARSHDLGAMYFLDLDGNPTTTEAVVLDGIGTLFEETARFRDMTNGTVKSVAEWKKIANLPQYFEYVKHQDTK